VRKASFLFFFLAPSCWAAHIVGLLQQRLGCVTVTNIIITTSDEVDETLGGPGARISLPF
jgi:hypothetical protein